MTILVMFQVSYLLGPLHMSMMSMVGDLIKFFLLYSLNYFSFAIGITKLYSQYVQTATGGLGSGSRTNQTALNQTATAKTEFSRWYVKQGFHNDVLYSCNIQLSLLLLLLLFQ